MSSWVSITLGALAILGLIMGRFGLLHPSRLKSLWDGFKKKTPTPGTTTAPSPTSATKTGRSWLGWAIGTAVVVGGMIVAYNYFGLPGGTEYRQTIRLEPGTHNHLRPIQIDGLPEGSWRYDVQSPPMIVRVENREYPIAINLEGQGNWGLMLNNTLPKGKIKITPAGKGTLQFDIPAQQINYVNMGEYQLAYPIDVTITLR